MTILYYIHLSLIKNIYRKSSWKDKNSAANALSFGCLFVLFLFVLAVLDIYILRTEFLRSIFGQGYPLVIIIMGIGLILSIICSFFSPKKLTAFKINDIRRAINTTQKSNIITSVLYLSVYIILMFFNYLIIYE